MKTSELSGSSLDWAVGKCLGHTEFYNYGSYIRVPIQPTGLLTFCPSTDWAQGGPIIEREEIEVGRQGTEWIACIDPADGDWETNGHYGPTPLIAAMRCYVASKLGDDIEIPEEFLTTC